MVHPASLTRDRIIEAAIDLLHTHSYPAVGVKAICDAAGVLKGSFYHFFASKEDLVLTAVDRAWEEYRSNVIEPALAQGRLPALPSRHAPCSPAAEGERTTHACLFIRLATSITGEEPLLRARLSEIFSEWAELFGGGTEGWSALVRVQGRLVIGFAVSSSPEPAPA